MKQEVKTKDLYLSAFLLSEGASLRRVDRENGKCWFVFALGKKEVESVNKFWSGDVSCNAKGYADAIRSLKDRIFSQ